MTEAKDPPKPASTVLIVRDPLGGAPAQAKGLEVLMVRRSAGMAFGASAWVFPGGKVAASDAAPEWDEWSDGSYPHDARALRIAAAREVFEESGLVLATDKDGQPANVDLCASLDPMRATVEKTPEEFLQLVKQHGLRLSLDRLVPFAHWITPTFEPRRFDTHFFLVKAPADQVVRHDGREAVDHSWVAPLDLIEKRKTGEAKLMFPTRLNLQVLAQSATAADAEAAARAKRVVTVEPQVAHRADGKVLVIPAEAGYGLTEERMSEVLG
jgi:8-oxo-dGTP pyrophosphatase MutT (NUDIX family)